MAPARQRISYIIPSPASPVPRLKLPPHGTSRQGATGPLLLPLDNANNIPEDTLPLWAQHPRHRLGVSCLALDTSTQLVGRPAPEGILYSGGRDGLILSWDLNIPTKKRARRYGMWDTGGLQRSVGRWEVMTGWEDDIVDDEIDEEDYRSDGDVLGDVHDNGSRRKHRHQPDPSQIPYEEQWETDMDAFQPGKISQFRQSVQAHTDWVNDMLLCNYNQTVVSASSDGTVKAWSPHSTSPTEPVTLGSHDDYARCLTHCRDRGWVASGSFDRSIKIWDLHRRNQDALVTLQSPEASGAKSSVYALTTNPYGTLVASGSPERVVRMWDPRTGKRIGKLVGHTDNIRAMLISEDAKYLLTGSADASIKLWSISTQKCLHTFTHHTDSVWSLFSSHPSLEVFYSGDRSGIVCKVDVEGCSDVSEGECVVITQDSDRNIAADGVNKIVVMDDNLLWTATGSSSIKRWRVPGRRTARATALGGASDDITRLSPPGSPNDFRRSPANSTAGFSPDLKSHSPSPSFRGKTHRTAESLSVIDNPLDGDREGEDTWYGIPFESLVKLTSPNESFSGFGMPRGRDPEIATLYSAASVMSVPRLVRSPLSSVFQNAAAPPSSSNTMIPRSISPMPSEFPSSSRAAPEETLHPQRTARAEFDEREIASDAVPLHSVPDEVIHGDHGLVRCAMLNDRIHALTVDTAGEVAVWDVVRGLCLGRFSSEDIADASFCGGSMGSGSTHEHEVERSPREALETVKERIEGEAVVASWASIDTKTGLLTVHLSERCFEAEVYADEAGFGADRHFGDEVRINVGKWVLRNLFIHFIRDQHRASRRNRDGAPTENHRLHRGAAPHHIDLSPSPPPDTRPRSSSDSSRRSVHAVKGVSVVSSSNMIPAVAPPSIPPSTRSSPLLTPMIPLVASMRESGLSPIPQSPISADATPLPHPRRSTIDNGVATTNNNNRQNDYFSLKSRRPSVSTGVPPSPADDFGSWGTPKPGDPAVPPTPTTPGGGLMGRLKAFGKTPKRQASEGPGVSGVSATADNVSHTQDIPPILPKTPLQALLSSPLNPPLSNEAPTVGIPSQTSILIAEESASGWTTLYRGLMSSTGHDARVLEEVMPFWLLEYLLVNKIPPIPTVKVSFVLLPFRGKDPNEEALPELLNTTQSKLTASRFLRVRKLTHHVQDKLERMASSANSRSPTAANTPRSSLDARSLSSVSRPPRSSLSPSAETPDHVHAHAHQHRPRAEDQYEILCNDAPLPLDMTLAAVRQFVWRSSAELVMHYRRKVVS